jgi:hypothetical protein
VKPGIFRISEKTEMGKCGKEEIHVGKMTVIWQNEKGREYRWFDPRTERRWDPPLVHGGHSKNGFECGKGSQKRAKIEGGLQQIRSILCGTVHAIF